MRFVFLSATIPNALEFAEWIASLHGQPCHVVYTEYRPTPLQHYMFPSGGDGIHLIVDEQSSFQPANFQRAASAIKPRVRPKAGKGKGKGKDAGPTDTFKLVRSLRACGAVVGVGRARGKPRPPPTQPAHPAAPPRPAPPRPPPPRAARQVKMLSLYLPISPYISPRAR